MDREFRFKFPNATLRCREFGQLGSLDAGLEAGVDLCPPAPGIDRLLADPVPLGYPRHWALVRLAQDLDHLLLAEPTLLYDFLRPESIFLKFQSVRKSQGRSSSRVRKVLPTYIRAFRSHWIDRRTGGGAVAAEA